MLSMKIEKKWDLPRLFWSREQIETPKTTRHFLKSLFAYGQVNDVFYKY